MDKKTIHWNSVEYGHIRHSCFQCVQKVDPEHYPKNWLPILGAINSNQVAVSFYSDESQNPLLGPKCETETAVVRSLFV